MKKYYSDELATLIQGDALEYLRSLPDKSVDIVMTDPPYFLSNGGYSNRGGKRVSVNKGDWDKHAGLDIVAFYEEFLRQVKRVLTDDGAIMIFGNLHSIFIIGYLFRKLDFKILNNIIWQKSNPAPNLSRRMFTHSTEMIIWAKKPQGKHVFNYDLMRQINGGKQMKDVWRTPVINRSERRFGKHPTQKPLALMLRMLQACTTSQSVVLDPFAGSGTTVVAGKLLGIKVVGIDQQEEYLAIAKQRLQDYRNEKIGNIN